MVPGDASAAEAAFSLKRAQQRLEIQQDGGSSQMEKLRTRGGVRCLGKGDIATERPSARCPCRSPQVAGVGVGNTTLDGWVPSALRRFLPLAVLRTCLAEMVLLPTRFFLASAMSVLMK
jgi:hypothetical protein